MNPLYRPSIIARPKLTGLGEHFGFLDQHGRVLELLPTGIGVSSVETFSQGRPVRVERQLSPREAMEATARLRSLQRNANQYRLLDWNCEHFANWLGTGKASSGQIGFLAIAAVVAVLFAV